MGNTGIEVDKVEKQKRIYEISLMLRRKPMNYILGYIRENWEVETSQAYNYIKEAKTEWGRYFANVKNTGMGYYITQIRDLKDSIMSKEGLNKDDYRILLDIFKEEAKLMGVYPAEKHKIEDEKEVIVIGSERDRETLLENMTDEELRDYIKRLRTHKEEREKGIGAKEKLTEKIDIIVKKEAEEREGIKTSNDGDREIEMEDWTEEQWIDYIKEIQSRKEEREKITNG